MQANHWHDEIGHAFDDIAYPGRRQNWFDHFPWKDVPWHCWGLPGQCHFMGMETFLKRWLFNPLQWREIELLYFVFLLSPTLMWLFWTLQRGRRKISFVGISPCLCWATPFSTSLLEFGCWVNSWFWPIVLVPFFCCKTRWGILFCSLLGRVR